MKPAVVVLLIPNFIQNLAETASSLPLVCPEIVSRQNWGGRRPLEVHHMLRPVAKVIIHNTKTQSCTTLNRCSSMVRHIQAFHMEELEFFDIAYNFLVGGDGRIYEGVGWHYQGIHTAGFNKDAIGLGFIGDFTRETPSTAQLAAAKQFLQCGVELGELSKNYDLFGARQVQETTSPGLKLFREMLKWENFKIFPNEFLNV